MSEPKRPRGSRPPERVAAERKRRAAFSQWLHVEMQRRDLNQAELSEKSGIVASVISRWQNGRSVPDALSAQKLALAFHMDVDDVLVAAGVTPAPFTESPNVRRVVSMARSVTMTDERANVLTAVMEVWARADKASRS